jgi:hypothetical protein
MQLFVEIKSVRNCGEVIARVTERSFSRAEEAAAEFGLSAREGAYGPISREEAIEVLACVIHKDMAYGVDFVAISRARELAAEFVGAFRQEGTRFFTNGTFGKPREGVDTGASWVPATDATFDTGVLVLSSHLAACLWFADED